MITGCLLLVLGVAYMNDNTLGNSTYYIRHPSTALWVCILTAFFTYFVFYMVEACSPITKFKLGVYAILSEGLFGGIITFFYLNPSLFPSVRTSYFHRSMDRIEYYFWSTDHSIRLAGDELNNIIEKDTNDVGQASIYKDVVFTKRGKKIISENPFETVSIDESSVFRCEVKNLSWSRPLVIYKERDFERADAPYDIAEKHCTKIKTDEIKDEPLHFLYSFEDNKYERNYIVGAY